MSKNELVDWADVAAVRMEALASICPEHPVAVILEDLELLDELSEDRGAGLCRPFRDRLTAVAAEIRRLVETAENDELMARFPPPTKGMRWRLSIRHGLPVVMLMNNHDVIGWVGRQMVGYWSAHYRGREFNDSYPRPAARWLLAQVGS